MIDEGAALLRRLDSDGLGITAALWFYLEPSDTWRFIIASPEVQSQGPKHVYGRIQKTIGSDTGTRIGLRDIAVVPPNDSLIKLLSLAIKTGPNDTSGIRFDRNTINGQFIQDAYIYRLA